MKANTPVVINGPLVNHLTTVLDSKTEWIHLLIGKAERLPTDTAKKKYIYDYYEKNIKVGTDKNKPIPEELS